MTRAAGKLRALGLAMLVVTSVVFGLVVLTGSAAGNVLASGPAAASGAPSVGMGYATVTAAGNSGVTVAYDTDQSATVELFNGLTSLDSQSVSAGSGTVTLELTDSEKTSDFTGTVQLKSGGTVLAQDTAQVFVRDVSNPPSVDITSTTVSPLLSKRVMVGFDSDGVAATDLELRLFNDSSGTQLDTVSAPASGSAGGEFMKLSAGRNDFTARVELWDTNAGTKLAADTATVTVNAPSVDVTTASVDPSSSPTVSVDYDTGSASASSFNIQVMTFSDNSTTMLGTKKGISAGSGTKSINIDPNLADDRTEKLTTFAVLVSRSGFHAMDSTCIGITGGENCPSVTGTSVQYADGTDASNVGVTAKMGRFGMIETHVHESGSPSKENLSEVSGFDTSEEIWVNVTVDDADVGAMMGTANVSEFTVTDVDSDTQKVKMRLRSAEIFRNETVRAEDPSRWPTSTGAATTKRTVVNVSLYDFSQAPGDMTALRGAYLTSDAQAFRPPQVVTENGPTRIRIQAAGPHFETDGTTQNDGFYDAFIPDAMLEKMDAPSPSSLRATFQGSEVDSTVREVPGGVVIEADIHYSSGNLEIEPVESTSPSISLDLNGGGGSTDDSATDDGDTDATSDANASESNDTESNVTNAVADISVIDASLAATTVTAGDSVTVTATVENAGQADGSQTVSVVLGGRILAEQSVSLAAGESRTLTFRPSSDAVGSHSVSVGGAFAGTLVVQAAATPEPTKTMTPTQTEMGTEANGSAAGTTSGSGPGFGLAVTLTALLSYALARRRY